MLTDSTQGSGKCVYGRITEILAPSEAEADLAVAVVDVFDLKATRHPIFGMPVLARSSGKPSYLLVPVGVGLFTWDLVWMKTQY